MITIYKELEIDVFNDELIDMVGESTLSVDEVFEDDLIADYCNQHMDIGDIYEHDTVLKHIVNLWTKTKEINDEEKAKFLAWIGAQPKEV